LETLILPVLIRKMASLCAVVRLSLLVLPALAEQPAFHDVNFDHDLCKFADESCHLSLLQRNSKATRHATTGDGETGKTITVGELKYGGRTRWPEWPVKGVDMPEAVAKLTYNVHRPIKMLQWTNWAFVDPSSLSDLDNCSWADNVPTSPDGVVRDPDYDLSDVDVVLFHIPNLAYHWPDYFSMPRAKREGQLWYAMCGEPMDRPDSGVDCRLAHNSTFMADFDGFIGFNLSSDIPAIQDPVAEEMLREPIPDFQSRGPELATMAFSDCKGGTRQAWTQEVIDAFTARGREDAVLSYGVCFHNAAEPECHNKVAQRDRWMNPCASRPFKLVAENIKEDWYVTEKVWDALGEGTIPVYWGPKQVKLFVPPDSILFADDFPSTQALVDRMLSFSQEDFEKAWAWKTKPVSEWGGYNKAWRLSHETLLPRICETAANILLGEETKWAKSGSGHAGV